MLWEVRYSAKKSKPKVLPTISNREILERHLSTEHGQASWNLWHGFKPTNSQLIFHHETIHDMNNTLSRVWNPYDYDNSRFRLPPKEISQQIRHKHIRDIGAESTTDFDFDKYDQYIKNKREARKAGISGSQYERHAWHNGIAHEDLMDAQRMFGSISYYGIGRKVTTRYPERWTHVTPSAPHWQNFEMTPAQTDPSFEPMTHEHFKDIYSRGIPIRWYVNQRRDRKRVSTHDDAINKWESIGSEKRLHHRTTVSGLSSSPGLKVWPETEERHPNFFPNGQEERLMYSDAEHRGSHI